MTDQTDRTRRDEPMGDIGPKVAKLRWIGLEREAEALAHSGAQPMTGVLAEPTDTD